MKNKKNIIIALLLIVLVFVLTGCKNDPESTTRPIQGFSEFWDIFVYPMAGIMWCIGKTIDNRKTSVRKELRFIVYAVALYIDFKL
jgi:hypothetical protein